MCNFAPQNRLKMTLSYNIMGEVVRGNRIGRQLGFPTANLPLEKDHPAADGVYAVRVLVDGVWKSGVANIGTRPTVTDNPERFLEVYLFDFDEDIYGKTIEVELVSFLRPEQKFDSVEALRRQIAQDKMNAEKILTP